MLDRETKINNLKKFAAGLITVEDLKPMEPGFWIILNDGRLINQSSGRILTREQFDKEVENRDHPAAFSYLIPDNGRQPEMIEELIKKGDGKQYRTT